MIRFPLQIIILTLLSILISCSSDIIGDSPDDDKWKNQESLLIITVDPVSRSEATAVPVEKIRTLRIIIVNTGKEPTQPHEEEDTVDRKPSIECNEFLTFNTSPNVFHYTLRWPTLVGVKDIYLIANEQSADANLKSKLDEFKTGDNPTEFENWIKSYSFSPDYKSMVENGAIYIPYTAVYTDINAVFKDQKDLMAYLVPVATKFQINFTNFRNNPVNVKNITLNYTNTANYLFAKVGSTNLNMSFPEDDGTTTSLYWIDWLAKIAQLSWENTEFKPNTSFNGKYGWITDYEIPSPGNYKTSYLYQPPEQSEGFSVPAVTTSADSDTIPGTYSCGPVYVPESRNFINPSGTGSTTYQSYYLTVDWEDTAPDAEAPEFIDNYISNLAALFRDTYVIINITMKQGDIEVYAEIQPWTIHSANGWVVDGGKD